MKIRPRTLDSGTVKYQLDMGRVNGKRKQFNFNSLEEAEQARDDQLKKREKIGVLGVHLTPEQLADAVLAINKLGDVSLTTAADYYLKHHNLVVENPKTLEALKEDFIWAKKEENQSKRYVRQLGVSLGSLARKYGHREAHEISKLDIEQWLKSNEWSDTTKKGYLGDVSAMFAWSLDQEKPSVTSNPCKGIKVRVKKVDEEIGTLTVQQAKDLLSMAAVARNRKEVRHLLGYAVLGLLCGIRPAEIHRLTWDLVRLDEKHVIVPGAHAKTRSRRVVTLSDNAVAWLKLMSDEERKGPICLPYHDHNWRRFRMRLGFQVGPQVLKGTLWPSNAMRHSFASYHYAMHEDEAKTQKEMGHDDKDVLFRHYRALKSKAEAKQFWGIKPAVLAS